MEGFKWSVVKKNRFPRNVNIVQVTRSGQIGFPAAHCRKFNLYPQKFATLFYDKEKKALAIHLSDQESDYAYCVQYSLQHGNQCGGHIPSQSFFKTYHLDPEKLQGAYRYEKEYMENVGDVYIIRLKEGEKKMSEPGPEPSPPSHIADADPALEPNVPRFPGRSSID